VGGVQRYFLVKFEVIITQLFRLSVSNEVGFMSHIAPQKNLRPLLLFIKNEKQVYSLMKMLVPKISGTPKGMVPRARFSADVLNIGREDEYGQKYLIVFLDKSTQR
jgi:hypothetical protein